MEIHALRREALSRCVALLEQAKSDWRAKRLLPVWLAVARRAQAASQGALELLR